MESTKCNLMNPLFCTLHDVFKTRDGRNRRIRKVGEVRRMETFIRGGQMLYFQIRLLKYTLVLRYYLSCHYILRMDVWSTHEPEMIWDPVIHVAAQTILSWNGLSTNPKLSCLINMNVDVLKCEIVYQSFTVLVIDCFNRNAEVWKRLSVVAILPSGNKCVLIIGLGCKICWCRLKTFQIWYSRSKY